MGKARQVRQSVQLRRAQLQICPGASDITAPAGGQDDQSNTMCQPQPILKFVRAVTSWSLAQVAMYASYANLHRSCNTRLLVDLFKEHKRPEALVNTAL